MMPPKPTTTNSSKGLKKCPKCESYTMKDECPTCNDSKEKTESISYRFPKIRDAPPSKDFRRR